jgi:fumarylacetoacetase
MGHLVKNNGEAYAAASQEMDVEIEFGFFIGVGSQRFERISIQDAEEHIFGVVMLNDWSSMGNLFPFCVLPFPIKYLP